MVGMQKAVVDVGAAVRAQGENWEAEHKRMTDSFTSEHRQTRAEMSLLSNRIGDVGKPNYGTIISGGVLLMVLGAAILGPMQLQHNETKAAGIKLAADAVDAKVLAQATELRFGAMQKEADLREEAERRELTLTRENLELQIKINRQDIRGLQP